MPNKPRVFKPQGHQTQRQWCDKHRGTASERGYGTQWKHLRNWLMGDKRTGSHGQPEFVCCFLCGRLATFVDHIIAKKPEANAADDSLDNLQPLCQSCHNTKGVRFDGLYGRPPDRTPEGKAVIAAMQAAARERANAIEARWSEA